MYWPGGFFDYYEGHSSAGSTTTALEWVVAGGASTDQPDSPQTFVLIANTENRVGSGDVDHPARSQRRPGRGQPDS